jgi:hypothetical protein
MIANSILAAGYQGDMQFLMTMQVLLLTGLTATAIVGVAALRDIARVMKQHRAETSAGSQGKTEGKGGG